MGKPAAFSPAMGPGRKTWNRHNKSLEKPKLLSYVPKSAVRMLSSITRLPGHHTTSRFPFSFLPAARPLNEMELASEVLDQCFGPTPVSLVSQSGSPFVLPQSQELRVPKMPAFGDVVERDLDDDR